VASNIKRTAIPASGYLYQTLVGIRLLCDWLDDPGLYEWVQFEADDQPEAQGLDDIVAQRPDRLIDLIQVKFTVDPFDPANALSWAWLLERKGARGRSLLEKWSRAAFKVGFDRVGRLALTTNRRPDAEFALQLGGDRVDLASLSNALRQEVEAHVGGAEKAELFFNRFEVAHSFAGYEALDRAVSARLEARHTDHQGWLTLYRRAIDWSVRKESPAPNGRITLEVLRSTLSEKQPRPLDQEFRVPAGYVPPDVEFADAFLDEAATGAWSTRVLWGSPGQGKSTFLSYLCGRLRERELPFVRHHYFLDLQDSSDRFTLKNVARSLIWQMQACGVSLRPPASDEAENLRSWISAYSAAYAAEGKRFFVVVDGLDHVWRENDAEIAPMEALFAQLLPLHQNATLILGTQRVDPAQMPKRLTRYLEPEHWIELPRMRLSSICGWLDTLREAGAYRFEGDERERVELAKAFERACEGHPLVLTYTFLALTRGSVGLTPQLVDEYAPEPIGDARAYYRGLWERLSWHAKDALHLMAEDTLIWPPGALERCLGTTNPTLEAEIGHLLATVDAGLVAFHGSLYVFIVAQVDHASRAQALLPNVARWLADDAPDYLRWAWLWLYESRLGRPAALLAGTTRSWAIDALTRAYPAGQVVRMLTAAEEAAFDSGDYEQAIRKRWLKKRIDSGLSYQLDDAGALEDLALRLTSDPYPALLLASEVNQSSIGGLHQLATLYISVGQLDRAAEVQERMRLRFNDRIRSGAMTSNDRDHALEDYLGVAAGTGRYDPGKVLGLVRRHASPAEIFESFLRGAGRGTGLEAILGFAGLAMPVRLRRILEVEALRAGAWAQARIQDWGEFARFRKHPLSACWRMLYGPGGREHQHSPTVPRHAALDGKLGSYDESEFAEYLHFIFFAHVGRVLRLAGANAPSGIGVRSERGWLDSALDRLGVAAAACGALFARGEFPPFSLVYRLVDLKRPAVNDSESWSDLRVLTKALVVITADLFFLGRPRSQLDGVPASEWTRCEKFELFALHHWRERFLTRHYRLLPEEVVRLDILNRERAALSAVGPFNEKSTEMSELCGWAAAYGLSDLAERLLSATYRYGIGYGWRKDWRLPTILDAVAQVSHHDRDAAASAVRKLAPIYTEIDKMTEKSGAEPSDLADLLLNLLPDAYTRFYRFLLDRSEWYAAERTFAAFVRVIDQQTPAAAVAVAFLWDPASRAYVREGSNVEIDELRVTWSRGAPESHLSPEETRGPREEAVDESVMPKFDAFPPEKLTEFVVATNAAKQFSLSRTWLVRWFKHWVARGRGPDLLRALSGAMSTKGFATPTDLLDPAFHLALRLHGHPRAFRWLVEAHRHRRGWTGHFYGQNESAARVALVAQHYRSRWQEFVAQTSMPVSDAFDRERDLPDVGLVSLLLQVGEVQRATSVLYAIVDATVEEFESQPLGTPYWLDGRAA
jgi:hypothetical protein